MKMVSAAKLRKAQDAILATRPYALMLDRMISDVVSRADSLQHPLLTACQPKNAELLVLTSDRGLAGAFNSNVLRRASRVLYDNHHAYEKIEGTTLGRKGRDFFKRRRVPVRKDYAGFYSTLSYRTVADIANELSPHFLSGEV